MAEQPHIAVVGGGPAGLRAVEVAAEGGARVTLHERQRSVGRKFLVAGRGGLNLTHGEPLDRFVQRYRGPGLPDAFAGMVREFSPTLLREWAAGLGIETFQQRTGRVYPVEMKAAPLLRRWLLRLKHHGVEVHVNRELQELGADASGVRLDFGPEGALPCDAAILALGGGSWTRTGSDGSWVDRLRDLGVEVAPLVPANCGWNVAWPEEFAEHFQGRPIKNIAATAGDESIRGELMITRHGLEGGALYHLTPHLRDMPRPTLVVDLKPDVPLEGLRKKVEHLPNPFGREARRRLRLTAAATALLQWRHERFDSVDHLCRAVKALAIPLQGPRPLDEAISSAGGILWRELDDHLMLRRLPGVFVSGEMIDWEAPTGGYLIQGCFATATRAARGALEWARASDRRTGSPNH
jgi:uncharacterized flavoprotein (TIGR03862 family)